MGFEQDCAEAMRDKCWGKPILLFAMGRPDEEVAGAVDKALCKRMREVGKAGADTALVTVAERFNDSVQGAYAIINSSLFPANGDAKRVIEQFVDDCGEIPFNKENACDITRMVTLGANALQEAFEGTRPRYSSSAANYLVVDFLHDIVEHDLQPAILMAEDRRRESPEIVHARFERVVSQIPFLAIADKILSGGSATLHKCSASRRPRRVRELAEQSLIYKH